MVICRICGEQRDNADLVNGVCDDCREGEYQREMKSNEIARMINSDCEQVKMEEIYGI